MATGEARVIDDQSAEFEQAVLASKLLRTAALAALVLAGCGLVYVWLLYTP